MHSLNTRANALAQIHSGSTVADVSRRLHLPYGTVKDWVHRERRHDRRIRHPCPVCEGGRLAPAPYTYLLGLYLGDGHIAQPPRHRAASLLIVCAEAWPGLIDACAEAMRQVFPDNSVGVTHRGGCRNVKVYSRHVLCLFPQHGPGKKHERRIALAPWQQRLVHDHPWEFVRGLVHSDGCRITNWATREVGGVRKRYEYPRYFFTNKSVDITRLYTDTLTRLGVEWRTHARGDGGTNVSVARRASVALMDAHVGPKR
ncbi:helix-turn-helix domain-containing protein [Streptomyces sp. TRM70308]|uniref:helix-turn-helix domain-containing protein n=1 Tax=Streptomyces sp. TRM70308 TaxID=3131932 RepID=UPI003D08A2D1